MAVPYSPSYIEHLGSILPQWPEFRDLYEFLSSPAPQTDSRSCKALIIDQLDNGQIVPRRFGTDSLRLRARLSHRSPRIRTRIMILQYAEAKSVSRELVDIIATKYGFSPLLLCQHFLDKEATASSFRPLYSEAQALEFGFYKFLHASVLILPSDDLGEPGASDSAGNWTGRCPPK